MLFKLSAMTAAVAAPAALFLGAGTAQADVRANAIPGAGGVTVVIQSLPPAAPSGQCTYTARAQGDPIGKPAPAINVPFFLPPNGDAALWFPSAALSTPSRGTDRSSPTITKTKSSISGKRLCKGA